MNTNRDFLVIVDCKNGSVVAKRPIRFFNTDKNTSNIFIKLVIPIYVDNDLVEYAELENASNYTVILHVKKPNGNLRTMTANLLEEGLFLVDLSEDYINVNGDYTCEFRIHTTVNEVEEITTSDSFKYTVNKSIVTGLEVDVDEQLDVIQGLIDRMDALEVKVENGTGGSGSGGGSIDIDLSAYAPINSPDFTGDISLGRKANTNIGTNSVALGYNVIADKEYSVALGYSGIASGKYSVALGNTRASGLGSCAVCYNNVASGQYSFVEGYACSSTNLSSHAEGHNTKCQGSSAHTEGYRTTITVNGSYSHAEGGHTTCNAEYSHAEGCGGTCNAEYSHAEGFYTEASGEASHSEGYYTIANGNHQHVQGRCNIEDTENRYAHIVGNGTYDGSYLETRSNAHTLDWNGNAWYQGDLYVGGTSQDDGNKVLSTADIYFDTNGNLCVTIGGVTKKFKPI